VVVVEWIVEARCWVLRNRAVDLRVRGLVFLGHLLHWELVLLVWWCGWGRPSPNRREGFLIWVFVSLGWGSGVVGGGCGWCSCPYFENCIVDASIFVVFVV
jgi:hypothetical protein